MKFFSTIALAMLCAAGTQAQNTIQLDNTLLTVQDAATGIVVPWEMSWGPDDYIWMTERRGRVVRMEPATGNTETVLDIQSAVSNDQEDGMLGMAFHPEWNTTPKVFIVYVYGNFNKSEKLVSFDWDGSELINETIIFDDLDAGSIHNGSRLMITSDNKILMTTGDVGDAGNAQDMDENNGKILRMNLDGSLPADNPFPNSYVYSYGHRNVQGLTQGPNGIIYSSEHGQNDEDEFNIIVEGGNYGWPNIEGAANTSSEMNWSNANDNEAPLRTFAPPYAVSDIIYYNHPAIPEWNNSVVMTTMKGFSNNVFRIAVMQMSADGTAVDDTEFFLQGQAQRYRDVCVNPTTGAIYVATNGTFYPGGGSNKILVLRNLDFESSIDEIATVTQDFTIFPNPADDHITLSFTESFVGNSYEIYNLEGKMVASASISSTTERANISDLPAGSYYTIASSKLGTLSRSFIVK